MSVAEVKMNAGGKWNIAGEIKMLKEGETYTMPVKYAAQVVGAGYGEYVGEKAKPAPEENKAIEVEENKAAKAVEEAPAEEETVPVKKEKPVAKPKKKKSSSKKAKK